MRRSKNLGKATFIALDKLDYLHAPMTAACVTPDAVPRLFDLIRVARDDVRPAFYFALRDTLVASDLDQASRYGEGELGKNGGCVCWVLVVSMVKNAETHPWACYTSEVRRCVSGGVNDRCCAICEDEVFI